jgi:hypothetical protein
MIPWMIVVAGYFAVGLALVFVGPAARLRRLEQERLEWQAYDHPHWKLVAFSCAIALAIIVLWPILIVSAARKEAAARANNPFLSSHSVEPSAELDRCISDIQSRYSQALPFADYREIASKLRWSDREHLDDRLERLGYVITGFATDPQGQELAVAISVLKIGISFALTKLRGSADSLRRRAKTRCRSGFRPSRMTRCGNFHLRQRAGSICMAERVWRWFETGPSLTRSSQE